MEARKTAVLAVGPQMFREFLSSTLRDREGLELTVVDDVDDGMQAVASVHEHAPDLLLLGLSLPRLSGMSVINNVRAKYPDMKILILTEYEADQYVLEAFQAGANGYCIKDASTTELVLAIESVMSGKIFISPGIAEGVLDRFLNGQDKIEENSSWDSITQREREILKLLAEGYKNKEIGEMLHISSKTVEKHRSNIMSKLGLHTVAALTAYAIERGLVKNQA